jgi:hypothetical protein
MFITIGDYCYNTDQIIDFGLDTSRKDEYITVELVNGEEDEVEFGSHKEALANFYHALEQLNVITYEQAKEQKDLHSHSAIEFLRG